ncbi:MAG: cytochrome c family protein [Coriobacteriaceae bacterium]|jgi:hypothetical protein|nr:cytochrome c family protein [Coriobacteriaceae bacterium]
MKQRLTFILCAFLFLLAGCSLLEGREGLVGAASDGGPGMSAAGDGMFPLASECAECHDGVTAPDGSQYSFVEDWRNSTHAQSALDPYFMAVARSETLLLPEAGSLIQETCASCHLPMADLSAQAAGLSRDFLDNASLPTQGLYSRYAEGVSCMLCHQLTEVEAPSATAFRESRLFIDLSTRTKGQSSGLRTLYGYHEIGEAGNQAMRDAFGYQSAQSDAERKSLICKVCHTLYTDSFTVEGEPLGSMLPEQVTATEWLHSSLADQSCQSCHMPAISASGPFSNNEGEGQAQGRIGSHGFFGANAYLMELNNDGFGPFDKGIQDISDFLQERTVRISLSGDILQGPLEVPGLPEGGLPQAPGLSFQDDGEGQDAGVLQIEARIDSVVGHKFPTGFPSRRAWLHVTVRDQGGTVVFESGAWDETGRILDDEGDFAPGSFEPHYQVIDAPGQVQVYESVMMDSEGKATTNLLQGVCYAKDNRILPPGFDKASAASDIAVVGGAFRDADFIGGGDVTIYRIPADPKGSYTVEVDLLYQAIAYRYLKGLEERPSAEQQLLAEKAGQVPEQPLKVASQTIVVGGR